MLSFLNAAKFYGDTRNRKERKDALSEAMFGANPGAEGSGLGIDSKPSKPSKPPNKHKRNHNPITNQIDIGSTTTHLLKALGFLIVFLIWYCLKVKVGSKEGNFEKKMKSSKRYR